MEKQLLLTVSDETTCLFGVRFLSSFFQNKSLINITLFYVAAHLDAADRSTGHTDNHPNEKAFGKSESDKGNMALEASRKILCTWGFSAERIACKIQSQEFGVVKDIIKEGREGLYDSVVLGKRGYSAFENLFSSSVTKRIMEDDIDFPIWISRLPEHGRRNVLLCVDGSDAGLRIADHVGFMLKDEDQMVTILHVDTGHKENGDAILHEAHEKLTANEVAKERIEMSVIRSHRVVHTILEEVERKAYAVVAVGRVGEQKSKISDWLIGSRSMKLLENMEKAVLWVSK